MTVPLDYVNEQKQIPTNQVRPSLIKMEQEAEKYEEKDASSFFGFSVLCLIEYVRELEAKLVELGVERNEDFQ